MHVLLLIISVKFVEDYKVGAHRPWWGGCFFRCRCRFSGSEWGISNKHWALACTGPQA